MTDRHTETKTAGPPKPRRGGVFRAALTAGSLCLGVATPVLPVAEAVAQEVDAMPLVVENRADEQAAVLERMRRELAEINRDLGRTSRVLSDLYALDSLTHQDIQTQREMYRDFGAAFARIPEAFERHYPALVGVFDGATGDLREHEAVVHRKLNAAMRERDSARRVVMAVADTLRTLAGYVARLPAGQRCDVYSDPAACHPELRAEVEHLDSISYEAKRKADIRALEIQEYEMAQEVIDEAIASVSQEVDLVNGLRVRLRNTALELSQRLDHVDVMLGVSGSIAVTQEMLGKTEQIREQIRSATERVWGEWGRVADQIRWTREDDIRIQDTAAQVQRILQRADSLTNEAQTGRQ